MQRKPQLLSRAERKTHLTCTSQECFCRLKIFLLLPLFSLNNLRDLLHGTPELPPTCSSTYVCAALPCRKANADRHTHFDILLFLFFATTQTGLCSCLGQTKECNNIRLIHESVLVEHFLSLSWQTPFNHNYKRSIVCFFKCMCLEKRRCSVWLHQNCSWCENLHPSGKVSLVL